MATCLNEGTMNTGRAPPVAGGGATTTTTTAAAATGKGTASDKDNVLWAAAGGGGAARTTTATATGLPWREPVPASGSGVLSWRGSGDAVGPAAGLAPPPPPPPPDCGGVGCGDESAGGQRTGLLPVPKAKPVNSGMGVESAVSATESAMAGEAGCPPVSCGSALVVFW